MITKARGRAAVRALPLACLVLLIVVGPARAEGDPTYGNRTFDRSPAEGLPGTVIQVSGTGCSEGGKPYEEAYVRLGNGTFASGFQYYSIHSDGTWGGKFTVPQEAPPGDYTLGANCRADDMVFRVPDQTFRVLDPNPPTSTSSTSPPTTVAPTTTIPSNRATSKPASSSSLPPTTTVATSAPSSEPTVEAPPSVPVAAAKPPDKPSDDGIPPAFVVIVAALLAAGGAFGGLRLRRKRAANEP